MDNCPVSEFKCRPAAGYPRHKQLGVFYLPSLPRHGHQMWRDISLLRDADPYIVRTRPLSRNNKIHLAIIIDNGIYEVRHPFRNHKTHIAKSASLNNKIHISCNCEIKIQRKSQDKSRMCPNCNLHFTLFPSVHLHIIFPVTWIDVYLTDWNL